MQNYMGTFVAGLIFLHMGVLLIHDKEIFNPSDPDLFFYMTAILALIVLIAGVLFLIVGIHGVQNIYRQDRK